MEFTQKDELGLTRTYYLITQLELDNETYVIYTDLIKDKTRDFRLLVGTTNDGKVIRVDEIKEKIVLEYFKAIEKDYKEHIEEMV